MTVHLRNGQDAIDGHVLVESDPMKTFLVPAYVWQQPHSGGPVFFLLRQERDGCSRVITINAEEILTIVAQNSKAAPYEN